jgi:hypothetical protein
MTHTQLRLFAVFVFVVLFIVAASLPRAHAHDAATCYEDMTCWDSRTMGNRIVGTIDPWERETGPNLAGVDTPYVMRKYVAADVWAT